MMRLEQLRKRALRAALVLLVFTAAAEAQEPSTLDELLDQARTGSQESRALNKKREAEFRAKKKERQRLLRVANATRDREERRSDELEARFSENELAIIQLQELLRNRLGNLGELFGVVRQVAGDTRSLLDASMTSAQFPDRSGPMGKLAESPKLPDIEALRGLWLTLLQEMTESGKVVRYRGTVIRPDGEPVESEVVRLGVFNAVADVIAVDERLVITYRTQLDTDTQDGELLTNVAGATAWETEDGSTQYRRTLTDGT